VVLCLVFVSLLWHLAAFKMEPDHAATESAEATTSAVQTAAEDAGAQDAGMEGQDAGLESQEGMEQMEDSTEQVAIEQMEDSAEQEPRQMEGAEGDGVDGTQQSSPQDAGQKTQKAEVFVGGLPWEMKEDELRKLMEENIGPVFDMRLMMNKQTGQNKGYAFVTFHSKAEAKKAVEKYHDSIVKNKKLRVTLSDVKNRLFVGNIPKDISRDDLKQAIESKGPGITTIDLPEEPDNPSKNRGFAFIEYETFTLADRARRKLERAFEDGFQIKGRTIAVNWADPRSEPDEEIMAQVKAVYVRHLPDKVTEESLRKLFEPFGKITRVIMPTQKPGQKRRDFGFVHYGERAHALAAIEGVNGKQFEDRKLEVTLAKPIEERNPREKREPARRDPLPPRYDRAGPPPSRAPPLSSRDHGGYAGRPGYSQPYPYGGYGGGSRAPSYGGYPSGGGSSYGGGYGGGHAGGYGQPPMGGGGYGGGGPGAYGGGYGPGASAAYGGYPGSGGMGYGAPPPPRHNNYGAPAPSQGYGGSGRPPMQSSGPVYGNRPPPAGAGPRAPSRYRPY